MSYPPQGLDKKDVLTNQATLLTRLSAARAGYLDNINQAGLLQLTAARGGYLDDVPIIEEHDHNRERWFGKSADQTGTDWATEASLTAFQGASGSAAFGTAIKVLGSSDTPNIAGNTKFDFHRIFVEGSSATTIYVIRFIYGTGDDADVEEAAGRYSDVYYRKESAAGRGAPADLRSPLLASTTKFWAKVKNASNEATLDFFVGFHEYP